MAKARGVEHIIKNLDGTIGQKNSTARTASRPRGKTFQRPLGS